MKLGILFLLLSLVGIAAAKKKRDVCASHGTSCQDCISANPKCGWCTAELTDTKQRCYRMSEMPHSCNKPHVQSPVPSRLLILKNRDVARRRPISPQKIELTLRRGATASLQFKVLAQKGVVSVKFRHPRAVKLVVHSDCDGFKYENKVATCQTMKKRKIPFDLKIKLKRCIPKPKRIKVIVDGVKKRPLKITITSKCKCDCEQPSDVEVNSPLCSEKGHFTCGMCNCWAPNWGPKCECSIGLASNCQQNATSPPCSRRGSCVCGECECFKGFTSRYCQCDNKACDYFNGQLCGGAERGICDCGQCHCKPGFSGPACEIDMASDQCLSPESKEVCNGHGLCTSNRCVCQGSYMGRTCDECPTCPGACAKLKPCVQCSMFKSGSLTAEECYMKCSVKRIHLVDDVSVQDRTGPRIRMCLFRDTDNCMFTFGYFTDADGIRTIKVQRNKMC